eukprot:3843918-Amphidinium_carterae.1
MLIIELLNRHNTFGAAVLIVCVVLIPAVKFAVTSILMTKPKWVSATRRCTMAHWLSELSPYQFNDILIACLVVAYVNLDIADQQPIFDSLLSLSAEVKETQPLPVK